jgi:hypothetical protein
LSLGANESFSVFFIIAPPLLIIFIKGVQRAFALLQPLWQQVKVYNGGF